MTGLAERMKRYGELDAKRTQGEWSFEDRGYAQTAVRVHANGKTVADVRLKNGHLDGPFIASAPSMHADLVALYGLVGELREALLTCQERDTPQSYERSTEQSYDASKVETALSRVDEVMGKVGV